MPVHTLILVCGSWLLLMIGIGIACARLMGSVDDYAIGGRRLGPWVTAISERASGESAWFLLGLPGAAYALGFTEFWSVIGIACGIFASWTLIALPLRRETERLGAITLPEYFAKRFGDRGHPLRVLSTVIILVFYTVYVAAQFVGAGQILNATSGLPVLTGLSIGAGIVVAYMLAGCFLAVAWTDLVQGLLTAAVCRRPGRARPRRERAARGVPGGGRRHRAPRRHLRDGLLRLVRAGFVLRPALAGSRSGGAARRGRACWAAWRAAC